MEGIDEFHNKLQVAVCALKQLEVNCLRNISHERDDISERETALVKCEEELQKQKAIIETEKKMLENLISRNLAMAPTQIKNTLNMVGSYTSLDDITLNMNTENAMLGTGDQIINYNAPSEDIEDIKSTVSDVLTQIQDGKMDKEEIIENMKGMEKELSSKVDHLEKTIADQLKQIQERTVIIRNLLEEKAKIETELKQEKGKKKSIQLQGANKSNETPLTDWPNEEEIKQEPELNFPEYFQTMVEKFNTNLRNSENERRLLEAKLAKKSARLRDVEKEKRKLAKITQGSLPGNNNVNIFELIEREHESLKREIDEISKERIIKDKDLLFTLEQSKQNESFLKKEYQCLQLKAKNAKQGLLRSNAECEEVRVKLSKLQTAFRTEQNDAHAAKDKLANIVSCLQQLIGLPHGKEGQEWSVNVEHVRRHLEKFIENKKREMSQLENETKNKKEHIKSLRNTISKHEDSMIQLENRFDSTRNKLAKKKQLNLDLARRITSLENKLQEKMQSEQEKNKYPMPQRQHNVSSLQFQHQTTESPSRPNFEGKESSRFTLTSEQQEAAKRPTYRYEQEKNKYPMSQRQHNVSSLQFQHQTTESPSRRNLEGNVSGRFTLTSEQQEAAKRSTYRNKHRQDHT